MRSSTDAIPIKIIKRPGGGVNHFHARLIVTSVSNALFTYFSRSSFCLNIKALPDHHVIHFHPRTLTLIGKHLMDSILMV